MKTATIKKPNQIIIFAKRFLSLGIVLKIATVPLRFFIKTQETEIYCTEM